MKIVKNMLPESLYSWKSPYTMKPTRIVVHNTANDASASNEVKYMHRDKSNGVQVSYHYAVDDKQIVQALPEDRNGWHAGDGRNGKGNREGIGIEICYSKSGGDRFIKAEENAVELIVDILKRYGWGIDKVTKHQDYSGKYCPHRTLDMGWARFIKMIEAKLEIEKYTLITEVPVYTNSTNALNGENPVKKYSAGEYYVFNKSQGMINITKTEGRAGGWINPKDNVIAIESVPEQSKEEAPNKAIEEEKKETNVITPSKQENTEKKEKNSPLLWLIQVIVDFVRKIFTR